MSLNSPPRIRGQALFDSPTNASDFKPTPPSGWARRIDFGPDSPRAALSVPAKRPAPPPLPPPPRTAPRKRKRGNNTSKKKPKKGGRRKKRTSRRRNRRKKRTRRRRRSRRRRGRGIGASKPKRVTIRSTRKPKRSKWRVIRKPPSYVGPPVGNQNDNILKNSKKRVDIMKTFMEIHGGRPLGNFIKEKIDKEGYKAAMDWIVLYETKQKEQKFGGRRRRTRRRR